MQNTATVINSAVGAAQKVVNGTAFSPRFYTTDFDAMNRICIEPVRPAWDAMMAAYESDNNYQAASCTTRSSAMSAIRISSG